MYNADTTDSSLFVNVIFAIGNAVLILEQLVKAQAVLEGVDRVEHEEVLAVCFRF